MVQRRGKKFGIRSSNTLRLPTKFRTDLHHNGGEIQKFSHLAPYTYSSCIGPVYDIYSLNRHKRWELVESPNEKKISKTERIAKNALEKKKKFKEHLKERGKAKKQSKRTDNQEEEENVERKSILPEKGVALRHYDEGLNGRLNKPPGNVKNHEVHIYQPLTKREMIVRQRGYHCSKRWSKQFSEKQWRKLQNEKKKVNIYVTAK